MNKVQSVTGASGKTYSTPTTNVSYTSKVPKLVPNLKSMKNVIVNHRTLPMYLEMDMKIYIDKKKIEL